MSSPLRKSLVILASILSLSLATGTQTASGQTPSACEDALADAERNYLDGDYDVAVELLVPCVRDDQVSRGDKVAMYRLMGLAYLKLHDLDAAQTAVLQLLSEDPSYRSDPVNDVPEYRALVQIVRNQLGIRAADTQEGEPELPTGDQLAGDTSGVQPAGETTAGTNEQRFIPARESLLYSALIGFSSYGGERGAETSSIVSDFAQNAGPSLGLRVEYGFETTFNVGLNYTASRYPHIKENKGQAFQELDPDLSSHWVHFISATFRVNFWKRNRVSPYVTTGFATTFHQMNSDTKVGVGPHIAIGADVRVDPSVELFMEVEGAMIFPGDALDLADQSGSYDPLTNISIGMRHRLFSSWN